NPLTQTTLCEDVPVIQARLDNDWQLDFDGYCTATHKQLTTVVDGVGDIQPFVGSQVFPNGTVVNLTAVRVAGGDAFSHWDSASPGSSDNLTVTLDTDQTHTAHFVAGDYTLDLQLQGTGVIYPAPGIYAYLAGQTVHAYSNTIPGSGYAFDRWEDGASSTLSIWPGYDVTMTSNKTLVGIFSEGGYSLNIQLAGDGSGWTYPEPGIHTYKSGRTAYATATAAQDSGFAGWTGSVTTMSPVLNNLYMNANKTVTANFDLGGHTLLLGVSGTGGMTNPPTGTYRFAQDSVVPLSASTTDYVQYAFKEWQGDIAGSSPSTTITMSSDKTATALFGPAEYTLTVGQTGSGTITPPAGTHAYDYGQVVNLVATPSSENWIFGRWSGDYDIGYVYDTAIEVEMFNHRHVHAIFVEGEHRLVVSQSGRGYTNLFPSVYGHMHGEIVNLRAWPEQGTGQAFKGWRNAEGVYVSTAQNLIYKCLRIRT
ncbi:MAG: hypothetical protein HC888_10950, partial [Candidatus Competibacteraceae bacterium]|nr:hypothetical protein [Candidatus Competibacteraceae bacterium]